MEDYMAALGVPADKEKVEFHLIAPQIWLVVQHQLEKQGFVCTGTQAFATLENKSVCHVTFEKPLVASMTYKDLKE